MNTVELHQEAELIALCKRKDARAQVKLYNKYCRGMFAVSVRILKDAMKAEDVMQEAFLSAFDKLDDFSGEVPFGAWLKRIVVNKSLDSLKGAQYYSMEREDLIKDKEECQDLAQEEDVTYELALVKQAMNELPGQHRGVLSLFYLEGYDHEEIAEIMGVSYANSRVLLNRAKNKLRSLIN